MPLAKFDPWQCLRRTDTNAYHAYPAYSVPGIGSLGMLGIGTHPSIGDFEERVAILEEAAGHTRQDAEHIAAHALGLRSAMELRANAIRRWRQRLNEAKNRAAGQSALIADALNLVDGPWIGPLVALGWDEVSLFGCDPAGGAVVGLVADIRIQSIVAATADSVCYRATDGVARHHYRFPTTTCDVRLIWEFDGEAELSRT